MRLNQIEIVGELDMINLFRYYLGVQTKVSVLFKLLKPCTLHMLVCSDLLFLLDVRISNRLSIAILYMKLNCNSYNECTKVILLIADDEFGYNVWEFGLAACYTVLSGRARLFEC